MSGVVKGGVRASSVHTHIHRCQGVKDKVMSRRGAQESMLR